MSMGEAARRRELQKLQRASDAVHAEGQGVWQIAIVSYAGVAEFLGSHGPEWADMVKRALRGFRSAKPPKLCLRRSKSRQLAKSWWNSILALMGSWREPMEMTRPRSRRAWSQSFRSLPIT